jgi:hypothetical protein
MNTLEQIQAWYRSACDGDWEHSSGVKIETLDNPGWSVAIDLSDTPLEEKPFITVENGVGDGSSPRSEDWFVCRKEGKQFRAFGSPMKLEEMLLVFLRWKDENVPLHS